MSVDLEGWLMKQGVGPLLGKRFKKRWFKLKDLKLYYYKANTDPEAIGFIDLKEATSVERTDDFNDGKAHFVINTPGRAWQLVADTTEQMQRWIYSINQAISPSGDSSSRVPAVSTPAPSQDQPPVAAPMASEGDGFALSTLKRSVNFLQQGSQVTEFWDMYSDSVSSLPSSEENQYQFVITADMEKITWRTLGTPNRCIQSIVDFFYCVGAPQQELDRLNSVGQLINPSIVGYWVTVSSKLGIDGGWFFPVKVSVATANSAVDESEYRNKLQDWLERHNVTMVQSVSRDMGAEPPRQSEISFCLPGSNTEEQLEIAIDAFKSFGFDPLPDAALVYLRKKSNRQLRLFVNLTFEGFVKLGILSPQPQENEMHELCGISGRASSADRFKKLQADIKHTPAFVEFLFLKPGFGYGVYKEGFDVAFHYSQPNTST